MICGAWARDLSVCPPLYIFVIGFLSPVHPHPPAGEFHPFANSALFLGVYKNTLAAMKCYADKWKYDLVGREISDMLNAVNGAAGCW